MLGEARAAHITLVLKGEVNKWAHLSATFL